jgi:asparagine synthase (glutamine-hydrolysing)
MSCSGFFSGRVDWRVVPPQGANASVISPAVWEDGRRRYVGPGIEVILSQTGTAAHLEPGRLVLVSGGPGFQDAALAAMAAGRGPAATLAHAIARHGRQALSMLRGRFSVVCIDTAQRQVWLATDRFGVWPLCYSWDRGVFAFSDRADRVPTEATPTLDPQAVVDYLYFHVIPAPATVFAGVRRVDAAELVVADDRGVDSHRYWAPVFADTPRRSLSDLKTEFVSLLRSVISAETSHGVVGSYLSGGTDSSTVSGMIGAVTGTPARTYSIGFEAEGYDEMAYARIAARHFGTDHHEYYVTPQDLVESIPRVATHFDQPFGNSSALPGYYCAKRAAEDGVTRLLAGDGGDELFGGNTRYAKQRVFAAYEAIPEALRKGVLEPLLLGVPGIDKSPVLKKAASYVRQANCPMPDRMASYNLLMRIGPGAILADDVLRQVDLEEPLRQMREVYRRARADALVDKMLAFDWKYTLADSDLPKVTGSASLAGVSVGFPLLSDELVDFSLQLAPELKVKGLKLRYFFKTALSDFLPREILLKKKHGFGLPFGVWLLRHRALFDLARDSLAALPATGLVRRDFVDRLMGSLVREHPGYYGEMVWILMMLAQWLHGANLHKGSSSGSFDFHPRERGSTQTARATGSTPA